MDSVRLANAEPVFPRLPCTVCGDSHGHWDAIAGKPYCPNCLESLAVGEADALIVRADRRRCGICYHLGTLTFHTFPLHWHRPIEMDLCGDHLRGLIARRLGPHAFEQLRRQLSGLDLEVNRIFLLHEAFYDVHGRALQPALDY
jgi:hypothetical protein